MDKGACAVDILRVVVGCSLGRIEELRTAVEERNPHVVVNRYVWSGGLGPDGIIFSTLILTIACKDDAHQLHVAVFIVVVERPVGHGVLYSLIGVHAQLVEFVVAASSTRSPIVSHILRQLDGTDHIKLGCEQSVAARVEILSDATQLQGVVVAKIHDFIAIQILIEGQFRLVDDEVNVLIGS